MNHNNKQIIINQGRAPLLVLAGRGDVYDRGLASPVLLYCNHSIVVLLIVITLAQDKGSPGKGGFPNNRIVSY